MHSLPISILDFTQNTIVTSIITIRCSTSISQFHLKPAVLTGWSNCLHESIPEVPRAEYNFPNRPSGTVIFHVSMVENPVTIFEVDADGVIGPTLEPCDGGICIPESPLRAILADRHRLLHGVPIGRERVK